MPQLDPRMADYTATITHHSLSRAPEIPITSSTLTGAKTAATKRFGGGFVDHVIQLYDAEGRLIASKRIGDRDWLSH